MCSRSKNLEFLLTQELATYLRNASNLDACSSELKNSISRVLEKDSSVPFSVINDCYQLTTNLSCDFRENVYLPLWRILLITSIVLPSTTQPPKNHFLNARREKLKDIYANKCYEKMTRDIGSPMIFSETSRASRTCFSEFKYVKKQLIMVINFIFIVVSAFGFGYFLPDLISLEYPVSLFSRMICGLLISLIVLAADFYFLIRNFSLLEKIYG
uniref:SJCHGC04743 protein n=1 Tax=Schistosoma japonicum TaxID=6182 RepID=Q5DBG4_SCHJA|nr:SJCHGC04743 protein [Schistosoma japonicum]